MMNVFLTGARGYLGSFLIKYLPEKINLIISAKDQKDLPKNLEFVPLDITRKEDVLEQISKVRPDIVIHSAAISLPDVAEENKEMTYEINVKGTANVVEACERINSKLIHISTDYVFSSRGNYTEEYKPDPVNYYGFTKVEAEKIVLNAGLQGLNYLILRPSFLYGVKEERHRENQFYNIYNKLKNNQVVNATNQKGCPTLVDDLALCIYKMLDFKKSGIYHTAGEPMTRYDFAKSIANVFNLDESLVHLTEIDERKAKRPHNTTLICDKLENDFGIKFRNVNDSLTIIKNQLKL